MAVTYYDAVIVTENHLRFVIGRHIACKCLLTLTSFANKRLLSQMIGASLILPLFMNRSMP